MYVILEIDLAGSSSDIQHGHASADLLPIIIIRFPSVVFYGYQSFRDRSNDIFGDDNVAADIQYLNLLYKAIILFIVLISPFIDPNVSSLEKGLQQPFDG
jgi:hypothetical protein